MAQPRTETGPEVYHEPPYVFNEDQYPQAYTFEESAKHPDSLVTGVKNKQQKKFLGPPLTTFIIFLLALAVILVGSVRP